MNDTSVSSLVEWRFQEHIGQIFISRFLLNCPNLSHSYGGSLTPSPGKPVPFHPAGLTP